MAGPVLGQAAPGASNHNAGAVGVELWRRRQAWLCLCGICPCGLCLCGLCQQHLLQLLPLFGVAVQGLVKRQIELHRSWGGAAVATAGRQGLGRQRLQLVSGHAGQAAGIAGGKPAQRRR